MRDIEVSDLRIGEPLEGALRDAQARILFAAGEFLTAEMVQELRSAGYTTVYQDEPGDEDETASVDPERLARAALMGEKRLRSHMRERWAIRASIRRGSETIINERRRRWERLPLRLVRGPANAWSSETDSTTVEGLNEPELYRARNERIAVVRRIITRLVSGETVGAGTLSEVVDELIDEARRRQRLFATVALGTLGRADALAEHCFATGALSIGIAIRLGWTRSDVRAAGLAGILADAGLALLPMPVRTLNRPLTDIELNAVRRHSTYSAALIDRIIAPTPEQAIPECVQLAVFQHHEREDGSGYPSGIRGHAIHDIAKVVATADVLAGSIAPRAHRPPLPAPTAIAEVVRQANAGVLDRPSAKALVELCGIYPPGSRVRLSTGHDALVLCTGRSRQFDRPVVRVLAPAFRAGAIKPGEPLDLSWWREEEISIAGTLAA